MTGQGVQPYSGLRLHSYPPYRCNYEESMNAILKNGTSGSVAPLRALPRGEL